MDDQMIQHYRIRPNDVWVFERDVWSTAWRHWRHGSRRLSIGGSLGIGTATFLVRGLMIGRLDITDQLGTAVLGAGLFLVLLFCWQLLLAPIRLSKSQKTIIGTVYAREVALRQELERRLDKEGTRDALGILYSQGDVIRVQIENGARFGLQPGESWVVFHLQYEGWVRQVAEFVDPGQPRRPGPPVSVRRSQ